MNLDEIPKQHPFEAPEGYFEELPLRIQTRLHRKPSPVRFMVPRLAWAGLAVSAVVLIVFLVRPAETNPEALLQEVSTQDLVAFLDASEMDYQEIVPVLTEAEADEISASVFSDQLFNSFDLDEDLEMDSAIDPDSIF